MADGGKRRGRLSRNVYVVSVVSFFQDAASEMLYPVLPFFVTSVLGAPPAVLGLIEGLADGAAAAMKAASGRLADLRHRRPLVASGYGISAGGKVLLALAGAWPMVLLARFTDRVGKGLRGPPRDAIIADDTSSGDRGRAFGFHRAADTAGAVVGPLVGLGVYHLVGERFRPLLWIAVVPAFVSVAFVFLIRERPHPRLRREQHGWSLAGLPRRFWRVIAVIGVFSAVNFPDTLILLRATEVGLGFSGVVVLYVLYNLSYALLSYPAGVVSDRRSRSGVFAVGLCLFALTYLGLGLELSAGWLWVLLPLYGGYTALTDGVSRAWIADLVPASQRGTGLGIQAAVSGAGLLVAGVWAGLAWGRAGRVPFLISGVTAVVLAATILVSGSRLGAAGPQVAEGPPAA